MWLIEEKANNLRIDVWFNPPKAPIKAEKTIKIKIILLKEE